MPLRLAGRARGLMGPQDRGPIETGTRAVLKARLVLAALLVADAGVFGIELARGGHGVPLAILSVPPLVASLLLPTRLTAAVAVESVLLAAGLLLRGGPSTLRDVTTLAVVALLAGFAVLNCIVRWRERHRLQVVRDIARVAESALLRVVPARTNRARFASRYSSAAESARIGGDLLEVVGSGEDVTLLIGDVRGKGLPAVRHAMTALGSFRAGVSTRGMSLVELARVVDDAVSAEVGDEDFVTALFVRLGPSGFLEIVNCGHPPPLRLTPDRTLQPLSPQVAQPPLGLGPRPRSDCYAMSPGDRVLFCTDGLLEARNGRGEFFRLEDAADLLSSSPLEEALDLLLARVRRHAGGHLDDDVAVLLMEVTQPSAVLLPA